MKEVTKLCPFNRMRPCVRDKCSLWRVDVCVLVNIDKELYTAVDVLINAEQYEKQPVIQELRDI